MKYVAILVMFPILVSCTTVPIQEERATAGIFVSPGTLGMDRPGCNQGCIVLYSECMHGVESNAEVPLCLGDLQGCQKSCGAQTTTPR